ncbi:MAG TPA: hypothetical protein VFJ71_07185 [Candidatus Limnocylindrales bacterium]|nr:hypothetical protein [Candidatus Limnocylindrales bacterium]
MPADLLLPAFALTLVVNAVIVAIAIRALRDGGTGSADRPGRSAGPSHAPATPDPRPDTPLAHRPIELAARPREVPTAPTPDPSGASEAATASAEPPPPSASGRTRTTQSAPAGRAAEPAGKGGRRRKFSLPPLDEDHEKVSRSIETFLGVSDDATGAASSAGAPDSPRPAGQSAAVAVVTVAVIQLDGPGPHDVLERTVRSTARAADEVTIDRRGRVRVVLPGTGEVAAKAYLRRIRAIVEPIAEATEPPSRIVIATATEIDGAVGAARRRADRRLAVALRQQPAAIAGDGAADDAGDEMPEPRAAGT